MKKFLLNTALVTILFLAFSGCSSDSDSSCTPIPCLNGGVSNSDCGCDCPDGYTGTDCGSQITPFRIKVNKVRVKYFPNTNGSSNWDFSDAPDIFVRLGLGTGSSVSLIYDSNVINNVLSDGVVNYDFIPSSNVYINSPLATHTIILGDYDTISSHELMGGFTFTPYNSTNDFPNTILLQDLGVPLSFELFVTYEW